MPVIILLIAVLAVIGLASFVIWTRRAASCARIIDAPTGPSEQEFAGDVMCRYVMTSGSFARLEFHDWGVRIRGIAIVKWLVPTWEARYSELEARWPEGTTVPMPEFWGGYRVLPEVMEFWAGRPSRLHDRLRYRRAGQDWVLERLAP